MANTAPTKFGVTGRVQASAIGISHLRDELL